MEAVCVLGVPLIPFRFVHVMELGTSYSYPQHTTRYQAIPLRFTGSTLAKAYLNSGGNGFLFMGAISLLFGLLPNLSRLEGGIGSLFCAIPIGMLMVGGIMKAAWFAVGENDELIKDCIGCTEAGFSDPYHWPARLADARTDWLREKTGVASLVQLAKVCQEIGQRSGAMICVRLAMRLGKTPELRHLFETLLNDQRLNRPASPPASDGRRAQEGSSADGEHVQEAAEVASNAESPERRG